MQAFDRDELERGVERLIKPQRRERVRMLLQTEKGRRKFVDGLRHFDDFDERCVLRLDSSEQDADAIADLLVARGAPDECYLMSAERELDCQAMPLRDALAGIVGQPTGTLVLCVPGRLGYFEGEVDRDRYVLHRST